MLGLQILPSRVLRQIEGGNEGRVCIVIDAHFHIFNRARLDHRKMGFWILRRQQLPKCKLCLATVVIRVGLTLLMIPLKTTAIQILWTNVQKWWTNTNSRCEQTWFVCGAWPVGLFLKMQNLQQLFRNLMIKLKIHPNHWICPICCIVLVLWLKVQMLWLNVDSFRDNIFLVFLWRLVSILHRSLRLQFWCKFAPVQPQKKWFGLLMRGEWDWEEDEGEDKEWKWGDEGVQRFFGFSKLL